MDNLVATAATPNHIKLLVFLFFFFSWYIVFTIATINVVQKYAYLYLLKILKRYKQLQSTFSHVGGLSFPQEYIYILFLGIYIYHLFFA